MATPIESPNPLGYLVQARQHIRLQETTMARQVLSRAMSFLCEHIPSISGQIEPCLEAINVASRIHTESAAFTDLEADRQRLAAAFSRLGKNYQNAFISGAESMEETVCCSKPQSLQLLITTDCNLSCIMCWRVRSGHKTLSYDVFDKLWDILPSVSIISWQGGEVFVVDYFKKIMKEIISRFPHITHQITTNGLLIDKEMAAILADGNVSLLFSIDSVAKKTYESIRVGGNFDTLLKNLEIIGAEYAKRNCTNKFKLNAVVMRQNMRELHLFPEFCKKYLFGGFTYGYLRALNPDDDIFINQDFTVIQELVNIIEENEKEFSKNGIGTSGDLKVVLKNKLMSFAGGADVAELSALGSDGANILKKHLNCVRPWTNLAIFYDGTIKPSCECNLTLGNIYTDRIEDVWNGSNMRLYREGMINGKSGGTCSAECIKGIIQKEYEYMV